MTFTSKTRGLLLVIICSLLCIATVYWFAREDAQTEKPEQATLSQHDVTPASEESVSALVPESAGSSVAVEKELPDTPSNIVAWGISMAGQPSIPLPEGVVDYERVAVDMESPAFPAPGDTVSLRLPRGAEARVKVRSSNENPNGDYSWRGYLEGHGNEYPAVMTYGANSVFATITTPEGSYTMESVNGSGWVYKNPSEFELSVPGKNDFLDVPDNGHHNHGH